MSSDLKSGAVGFTGTRTGMSSSQMLSFKKLVKELMTNKSSFHHGDCIGADAEAHDIVLSMIPDISIVIHPPLNGTLRAYKDQGHVLPPKDYIVRNHNIVDSTEVLVAAPCAAEHDPSSKRSGTWATIRYARSKGKKIYII
jgi:hypothetical protein